MKGRLFFALFLFPVFLFAQTSGEILYEEKTDIHSRMTGEREQYKEFVPQFRTHNMVLRFADGESMYTASEKEKEIDPAAMEHGGRMRFRNMKLEHKVYINYDKDERVEARDFMDKKFLIKGAPETYPWKLTGETMQVGQYECHKATFSDSLRNVVAWFTMQIPVPVGPGQYGQLPGIILHVDINEGETTLTAQEIKLEEIDPNFIEKPSKGKEVTQEEFDEIIHERMNEMGGSKGGGGRHMIIHRR